MWTSLLVEDLFVMDLLCYWFIYQFIAVYDMITFVD